jgi:dihydroorotate dehydrogenase
MGLNNKGVDALVTRVQQSQYRGILGINIGKNKDTPLDKAVNDYLYCLQAVYPHASYVTINISSPNTPGLRLLQQEDYLKDLLAQLQERQQALAQQWQKWVPLVLKVSPDENEATLSRLAELVVQHGIQGIIATNTTCSREGVTQLPHAEEMGGLSGKPLEQQATSCLAFLKARLGNAVTLIGLGGIDSLESAQKKREAGADLLQLYTGLIYQGPQLVRSIATGL